MKKLILILALGPGWLAAQTPQIANTVELKDTRTAVNSALATLDAAKLDKATLTALGDLPYFDGAAWIRLAGSTAAATRLLCQTGTGAISAAPVWCALVAGDIPDLSATYLPLHAKADTAGAADTATTAATATAATAAANLAGGSAGQYPYQSAPGVTGYHAPNAPNGPLELDANGNARIGAALLGADQVSTPANPASGYLKWYAKGSLWCQLTSAGVETCMGSGGGGGGTWGSITGTLSAQTDLNSALAGKAASTASSTVNGQVCALGSTCTVADSTKEPANANIQQHIVNTSNPHVVTKVQVGLGNVLNVAQEPALGSPDADGKVLSSTAAGVRSWTAPTTAAVWGGITGTLSSQTDLSSVLAGKAASTASTTVNGQACALGGTCTVTTGEKVGWGFCATSACSNTDTIANPYIATDTRTVGICYIASGTAPTGADLVIQVKKNGVNSFTVTQAAGHTYDKMTSASIGLVEGDVLTAGITQAGSTVPGQNVTVICKVN